MKIYGQLKKAILEIINGNPDPLDQTEGQVWYNNLANRFMFRDGISQREVVDTYTAQSIQEKNLLACGLYGPKMLQVRKGATLAGFETDAANGNMIESEILFAEDEQKYYGVEDLGNGTQKIISIGGGGGTLIEKDQISHGFGKLEPIYHNGITWVSAKADNEETLAEYIVTEWSDANSFIAMKFGQVELIAHGLVAGEHYFLSDTVAGEYNYGNPPSYSCPLFYVEDANTIHVEIYRPSAPSEPVILDGFADEIGTIIMQGSETAIPNGMLYCNGFEYDRIEFADLFAKIGTAYGSGDGTTTFRVPDFRNKFPRGWADGFGRDSTRVFGTDQEDAFETHTHTVTGGAGGGYGRPRMYDGLSNNTTINTGSSGSTETRPYNTTVKFYIRAAKTAVSVSIPALITDIVVGSADDVARNLAEYSTLQEAHDIANDGANIRILGSTVIGNTILTKRLTIKGSGNITELNGNVTLSVGGGKSMIRELKFLGNMVIDDTVTNNIISDCWASSTSVIIDNNTVTDENVINIMKEA